MTDLSRLDDEDDRRARALLAVVPRRSGSRGLSARLMTVARSDWRQAASARRWGSARSELVISAGVVTGAALLTLTPVAVLLAAFFVDAGIVVRGLTRACVMLVEWMNAGVSFWDLLARMGYALGTAVASPTGTVMLLGGVLTASLALAGLSRVLPSEQGDV